MATKTLATPKETLNKVSLSTGIESKLR